MYIRFARFVTSVLGCHTVNVNILYLSLCYLNDGLLHRFSFLATSTVLSWISSSRIHRTLWMWWQYMLMEKAQKLTEKEKHVSQKWCFMAWNGNSLCLSNTCYRSRCELIHAYIYLYLQYHELDPGTWGSSKPPQARLALAGIALRVLYNNIRSSMLHWREIPSQNLWVKAYI